MTSKARFQVVLLIENESDRKEWDHWTDHVEVAHNIARSMRERNPNASRVAVYDHRPTVTEF
jgi:hypothetical protein